MSTTTLPQRYFIIDFDSTFTQVEALDVLGEISLADHPERAERLQQIKDITDKGMEGGMSFRESLEARLNLLEAHRDHLPELIRRLGERVSHSFRRNTHFFEEHTDSIYIISNGFKDFIDPIVSKYGIQTSHVFANTFVYDDSGHIVGFDSNNVLSKNGGKVEQIRKLNLEGEIIVIGDGQTDYEIRESGVADKFYAFTENIERSSILEKADRIAPSLDEFLYDNNMRASFSYPKNRIRALLLEGVHDDAVALMKKEGYQVEIETAGLDEDELCERIRNVSILGIRSKTQVTSRVLAHANRLLTVGTFSIGTNQIDLEACMKKGVAVFNAPYSNTRSVVELAIGEIIMLIRNLPDKYRAMHEGRWEKSAAGSHEVRGKKLGIIGYGNIGAQLSVVAESMGMDVHYYDLVERLSIGNATACSSMEELLEISDIISLHVDGRPENKNLIDKAAFDRMKTGVIFLNLSRGHVVEVEALREAVEAGKVAGCAIDVFPKEPKSNKEPFESVLRRLPNTFLTPHIGGSTQEAQRNIGNFVPARIFEFINNGSTTNSVNFPNLQLPQLKNAHRLIHIHHNVPGIIARINNILSKHEINILGQYLKTNETIGYVITDIDTRYNEGVINELKEIEQTIKFRILY